MSEAKPKLYVRCPRQLVNRMFEDLRGQLPNLTNLNVDPSKKGMLLFKFHVDTLMNKSGKFEKYLILSNTEDKPTENDIVVTRKNLGNLKSVISLMGYVIEDLAESVF